MKKLICTLLALSLLAFAGCGKQNTATTTEPEATTQAAETTAAATEAATEAPTEEPTEAPTEAATEPEQRIHFRFDEVTLDDSHDPTCKLYNGTVKTDDVTFGSEDESVATIKNGIVVRVADGTTTVFAEFNGERIECVVTCVSR